MNPYYILDGHTPVPVDDAIAWAYWMDEHKYHPRRADPEGMDRCRVGSTRVGAWWVSTAFLGTPANVLGPPQLFETALFAGDGVRVVERYATWAEAEAGHARMVALAERHAALSPEEQERLLQTWE